MPSLALHYCPGTAQRSAPQLRPASSQLHHIRRGSSRLVAVECNGSSNASSSSGGESGGVEFPATEPGRPGNASWAGSSKVHGGGSDGSGGGLFGNLGRLQQQIKAFGLAGVVAYGLFNTLYYTAAFLIIWTKVLKVPSGLGIAATARRFVEVFALTWMGSQVSKAPRAAGALLLAPLVDRLLSLLEARLGLRSRQQAFLVVVGCCLAFAAALFCGVVLAWA